jgi:hypothetical protein
MPPDAAGTPNRSRWMRAYGQGLMEQPLLGMHYAANLERATHPNIGRCNSNGGSGMACLAAREDMEPDKWAGA